jgi:hydroxymethylbilane synthase
MKIRIGTRNSRLALKQTEMVIEKLKQITPNLEAMIVPIITTGDKITDRNLYDIGGKALFLKEIEECLLEDKIDIAVHSLKDVPGVLDPRFKIISVLERDDPRDLLITNNASSLGDLKVGAVIGTSSMRRSIILRALRSDLKTVTFRGNVTTRIDKAKRGDVDATILAIAGLKRLELDYNNYYIFPVEEMLPAAGQGVIAVQSCSGNDKYIKLCSEINHHPTWLTSLAERSFIEYLDASCDTPVAAYAYFSNQQQIKAKYMLGTSDLSVIEYYETETEPSEDAVIQMGYKAAKLLKSKI